MAELAVDHLMWAVADLDEGSAALAALTGCHATPGGVHPGGGTRNALLGIARGGRDRPRGAAAAAPVDPGSACYLEIIAPDPAQSRAGTLGAQLEQLPRSILRTWAVRTADLEGVAADLARFGIRTQGPRAMSRRTVAGELLAWRLLFAQVPELGGVMPFFIDWGGSPHPAATLGRQCALEALDVALPPGHALLPWLAAVAGVTVTIAAQAALTARLSTPNGVVQLR